MNEGLVTCKGVYMDTHTHTPYSTAHTHFIPHNAKWATGSDKQMSKWGDPSAGVCCCSLTPPALSLSGLVFESRCPLAIRDQHLTGLPITHTHHTSCATVCVIVYVCLHAFPAEAQLCLNATAECQSSRVCASHPHSRFALRCRRRLHIECDSRHVVFVYSPHTKTLWGYPRPAPAPPHLPARLSVLPSASVCLRTAVSLYPHSAQLWSTVSYQPRSASLHQPEKAPCYLALWCQTSWNTLIGRPVSW